MYFVEDGTKKAGFYECRKCFYRFLSTQTTKRCECPFCVQNVSYEIGPDESMEDLLETADLLEVFETEEEVAKMDALLSCAFTEDDSWI